MRVRAPSAPAETAEQRRAREAEEARLAAADAKSQAQEISAQKRLTDRQTRSVIRRFGARQAGAFQAGVGMPFGDTAYGGSGGLEGGGGGFGGGGAGGGLGGAGDFGSLLLGLMDSTSGSRTPRTGRIAG